MKTQKYDSKDKFYIWIFWEMYPDLGTTDFLEKNYHKIITLPEVEEIEFPIIEIYEISSNADTNLPPFVCIFSTYCQWQAVVVDNITDLFDLINYFSTFSHNIEKKYRSLKLLQTMKNDQ